MTSKKFSFKATSLLVVLAVFLSTFCAVLPVSAAARGAWAPNTAYAVNDTVTYSGSTYTCRQAHTTYGINYIKSQSQHFVDFSKIWNPSIRSNVKGYFKQRLLNKNSFSWSTAVIYMNVIPGFLNFICNLEPLWNDLKDLQRSHILKYIEWLHQSANKLEKRNSNPESYIKYNLSAVSKFLDDIQRYEYDIAPNTNTRQLLFPEDRPKRKKKPYDQIDYIPEYVLEQLFANLNHLHPEVPI